MFSLPNIALVSLPPCTSSLSKSGISFLFDSHYDDLHGIMLWWLTDKWAHWWEWWSEGDHGGYHRLLEWGSMVVFLSGGDG